jgi:hypothetical protein
MDVFGSGVNQEGQREVADAGKQVDYNLCKKCKGFFIYLESFLEGFVNKMWYIYMFSCRFNVNKERSLIKNWKANYVKPKECKEKWFDEKKNTFRIK